MRQELLRLALGAAQQEPATLESDDLAIMCLGVQMNALERLSPAERWALLAEALMSPHPGNFFEALRACSGLKRLLPEVEALFGVPQLCDGPDPVDVGEHQLRLVDEAARTGQPLVVRFAALMHKIGKGGTSPEIWPSHFKHEQRAHALLDGLAQRLAIPDDAMDLARLVVDECDRVHRASDMRAGAIAAMLERLQAVDRPERFEHLLQVCTCDYAAYPGHCPSDYPKAPRLRRALAAYVSVKVDGLDADAALEARAVAVAGALGSSSGLDGA